MQKCDAFLLKVALYIINSRMCLALGGKMDSQACVTAGQLVMVFLKEKLSAKFLPDLCKWKSSRLHKRKSNLNHQKRE